jgi:tyrosinase
LQVAEPGVTLPYWDWLSDREIPSALAARALLAAWGVTRKWDASKLPQQADLDAVKARTTFSPFQRRLEQVHNLVHEAVGGTMGGASSPADPLFFLHHANIDRIWANWEKAHRSADPPNTSEILKPHPIFGVKVASVLRVSDLGYSYR